MSLRAFPARLSHFVHNDGAEKAWQSYYIQLLQALSFFISATFSLIIAHEKEKIFIFDPQAFDEIAETLYNIKDK